uniref:exosortase C-terminal domain/associated protein EpsI n=1 Tax=Sphingomonas bacterium TaxID=1895847 RepID=UPI0015777719
MPARRDLRAAVALVVCALVALCAAEWVHAVRTRMATNIDLNKAIPARFGPWQVTRETVTQVSATPDDLIGDSTDQYDQLLSRAYTNAQGAQVMLMLAYKGHQEQENKVHRPEICYVAQGFVLGDKRQETVDVAGRAARVSFFLGRGIYRDEQVAYWIRSGAETVSDGWGLRLSLVRAAMRNVVPDGILVRVSTIVPDRQSDPAQARAMLVSFLRDMVVALPPAQRPVLAGTAPRPALAVAAPHA